MKKLLIGGIAIVVLAVVGYFGATSYAKHRAEREVAAALATMRAAGGTASHGKVEFDLWSRTLTVADVSVTLTGATPGTMKASRVVAVGVGQPKAGYLSAQRLEISGIEGDASLTMPAGMRMSYRAPSLRIDGFSGPVTALRQVDPSSALDLSRLWVEHAVATSADALTVPSVTMSVNTAAVGGAPAITADYTYSDIALRDMRDGRVASATVGKLALVNKSGPPMTSELARVAANGIDIAATMALFDPPNPQETRARQMYREVTAGPYTATIDRMSMRIETISLGDMGVVPGKLPMSDILAIVEASPPAGSQLSPAATRALADKLARLYEGFTIGTFEMRGMSFNVPDTTFRLAAGRINGLANGKIAEFAIEGLDGETPQKQPVKVGRFAFKGLDVAGFLRLSGQFATPNQQPSPDQLVAMLKMLEGIEIANLQVPLEKRTTPLRVESYALSWGQYVGALPSRARMTAKTSGPIEQFRAEPFLTLSQLGLKDISSSLDLGAQWDEGTRVFSVTPATFGVVDLLATEAKLSLGNVSRDMFSLDPVKVMQAAAGIEVGPMEISLQDAGALELGIRQYAQASGVPRAAAQAKLVADLKQTASVFTQASPQLAPVFAATARFIETPRSTITVKVTPNGRVGLLDLVQLSPDQALAALSRFTVEASVK